jgi:acyl-CoA thioesterase-1
MRDLGAIVVGAISLVAMSAVAPIACTSNSKDSGHPSQQGGTPGVIAEEAVANTTETAAVDTPQSPKRPTVLFIGTSLTAGYGLDPEQAYPAVLEHIADSAGTPITSINLGVSGETSAGALRRMDWVLRQAADIVVIETGANDALRGLSVDAARANIEKIVEKVQAVKPGTPILLVQMEAPPNLGTSYTRRFHDMYGEIAKEKGIVLAPFLLDGVAGDPKLNLPDGLHPNATGAKIVAQNVWRALEPVVRGR